MSVIALVPARTGSKGVKNKNFRELGGRALWKHVVDCVRAAEIETTIVSSDAFTAYGVTQRGISYRRDGDRWVDVPGPDWSVIHLPRPAELAQDDTPMIAVVQHALEQIPGAPDDIIVLLQPTQPFRTPEHVKQAIALLQETQADSVVSVVPLPLTHHPKMQVWAPDGRLQPCVGWGFDKMPARRQDVERTPTYKRDGTVYAFWRKTVSEHGTIYGRDCRPLILDPSESCELDTESDWAACEARWKATR